MDGIEPAIPANLCAALSPFSVVHPVLLPVYVRTAISLDCMLTGTSLFFLSLSIDLLSSSPTLILIRRQLQLYTDRRTGVGGTPFGGEFKSQEKARQRNVDHAT